MRQILRLSDAEAVAEGTGIAFTMETTKGALRMAIPAADLPLFVQFFAGIADLTDEAPPTGDIFPIPASGVGIVGSVKPDMTNLVVTVGGARLAFEIPSTKLIDTAQKVLLGASKPKEDSKPS